MRTITCILAFCLGVAAPLASADWIEQSDAITLEVMRAQAEYSPEGFSDLGLTEFDAEISDFGPGAHAGALAADRAQIARLRKLLESGENERVRQDIEILIGALEDEITSSELEYDHLIPFFDLHRELFNSVNSLLDKRNDPARYPAVLERLRKYNGRAEGYRPVTELARERSAERFGVEGLLGPYRGQLQNALGSAPSLAAGIRSLLEESGLEGWEADWELLATQLGEYSEWVRDELMPRAREESRLPRALYADALRSVGVRSSPQELIAEALYSYQLLRSQMDSIARRIAAQRDWKDSSVPGVIEALKAEQVEPDEVLPLYRQRLAELEEIVRREHIVTLPSRPAGIRLASEAESAAVPAPYMSTPQLIGNTGQYGEFVLVQSNPALGGAGRIDDFSHAAMTWTLTVHEARPGHELQFSRQIEEGVSLARAIYAFNSANAEGWALYAESVMQEFLPLDGQLFTLYMMSFRAARMFLDPMVNTGQISRDDARDFLMRELRMSEPMASSDADRYAFRWPGQATAYYYGYMALMRLRAELELRLGEDFDQLAFHDFILAQGLLPPDLMREAVLDEFLR